MNGVESSHVALIDMSRSSKPRDGLIIGPLSVTVTSIFSVLEPFTSILSIK